MQEIQKAAEKQHIWRGSYAVESSFASTLKQAFPWRKTPRTRLLLCLRAWGLHVAGEDVMLEKPPGVSNAVECIRTFGTPMPLLRAYYERIGVKLIL